MFPSASQLFFPVIRLLPVRPDSRALTAAPPLGHCRRFSSKTSLPAAGGLVSLLNMRVSPELFIFTGGLCMFENYKVFKTELAGRDLVIETGKKMCIRDRAYAVRLLYHKTLRSAQPAAKPQRDASPVFYDSMFSQASESLRQQAFGSRCEVIIPYSPSVWYTNPHFLSVPPPQWTSFQSTSVPLPSCAHPRP